MKGKWLVVLVCGIFAVAGLPRTTLARDKDWAVAGKILTGVVAAGVIGHAIQAQASSCRPAVVVSRPVHVTTYREVRPYGAPSYHGRPAPAPHGYARPAPPACPPAGPGEIVINTGPGRRLYQPAIHGHPAFVQVWSSVSGQWVSVERHPSIW